MLELKHDRLNISFSELHANARCSVSFKRTLRIPDDGRVHALPPGLGDFPLRHVDDHLASIPDRWRKHGGVMLPMFQSEAMWVSFNASSGYPFAVQIAAGKINAVTGEPWTDGLSDDPQNYMVLPKQPWLDGFCVERGVIKQFVAMPLGGGYTAEAQLSGSEEHGGVQIVAYPMKRERYLKLMEANRTQVLGDFDDDDDLLEDDDLDGEIVGAALDMGLGAGGSMNQAIYDDPFGVDAWDTSVRARCFVHLCNSLVWQHVTGSPAPTVPPTAQQYTNAGLPWFDYYDDAKAVAGSPLLRTVKSVKEVGQAKGENPLPENASVDSSKNVVKLGKDEVRDGEF